MSDAYQQLERQAQLSEWIEKTLRGKRPSRCRSCGAEIWFAHLLKNDGTLSEKMMPLDLGVNFDGNLGPVGGHERGVPLEFPIRLKVMGKEGIYRTHFQTCPDATRYRARRSPRKKKGR
jgi:hypothetical protein